MDSDEIYGPRRHKEKIVRIHANYDENNLQLVTCNLQSVTCNLELTKLF
jgi:hypothetical protein